MGIIHAKHPVWNCPKHTTLHEEDYPGAVTMSMKICGGAECAGIVRHCFLR